MSFQTHTQTIPRLTPHQAPVEAEQHDAEQPYAPESLPELHRLQEMANYMAQQANGLMNAGQLMVKDLRRQRSNYEREAVTLEQEMAEEFADIERRFQIRFQRNADSIQDIDAMISFHTTDAHEPPPQTIKAMPIQPRPRGIKRLLRIT